MVPVLPVEGKSPQIDLDQERSIPPFSAELGVLQGTMRGILDVMNSPERIPGMSVETRNADCTRTYEEVAAIMTKRGHPMKRGVVWQIEQRALRKLAKDPSVLALVRELGWMLPAE